MQNVSGTRLSNPGVVHLAQKKKKTREEKKNAHFFRFFSFFRARVSFFSFLYTFFKRAFVTYEPASEKTLKGIDYYHMQVEFAINIERKKRYIITNNDVTTGGARGCGEVFFLGNHIGQEKETGEQKKSL